MDITKVNTLGPFASCMDIIINEATKYRKDIETECVMDLYKGF